MCNEKATATSYICQLPRGVQAEIEQKVIAFCTFCCLTSGKTVQLVQKAMASRLCDLEVIIEVNDYIGV